MGFKQFIKYKILGVYDKEYFLSPVVPSNLLERKASNLMFSENISKNPKSSEIALIELIKHDSIPVRINVALHPNVTTEIIKKLLLDSSIRVKLAALQRYNMLGVTLADAIYNFSMEPGKFNLTEVQSLSAIAADKNTSADELSLLTKFPIETVRINVAMNSSTTKYDLEVLANDDIKRVSDEALRNPNISYDIKHGEKKAQLELEQKIKIKQRQELMKKVRAEDIKRRERREKEGRKLTDPGYVNESSYEYWAEKAKNLRSNAVKQKNLSDKSLSNKIDYEHFVKCIGCRIELGYNNSDFTATDEEYIIITCPQCKAPNIIA